MFKLQQYIFMHKYIYKIICSSISCISGILIIYYYFIFDNMSQKLANTEKLFRPGSSSTVVSSNHETSINIQKCQNKMITLRSIILQATKILANQSYVTQQDLQIVKKSQTVNDVLLFIRYMPNKQRKKSENNPQTKASQCCDHQREINELKHDIQKKRGIIIKLNEGYQQAKQYFEEQLNMKQNAVNLTKKQICHLKSQNEILKQKIQSLQNFRERRAKDLQRVKLQSDRVNKPEVLRDSEPLYHSQNNSICNREGSVQSRKSSYQQLKDMLQIMSHKIQNLSHNDIKSPTKSSIYTSSKKPKLFEGNHSQITTSSKHMSLNYPLTPSSTSNSSRLLKRESLGFNITNQHEKQFLSPEIFKQVRQLRQNQSKLLDRICEKDQIINDLIKIKGSSLNNQQINTRRS